MKKRFTSIACVIFVIVIIAFIFLIYYTNFREINYFAQLGVGKSHLRSDIVRSLGEAERSEFLDIDLIQKDYYEGICFTYRKTLQNYVLMNIEVTGSNFRIGHNGISVGSSQKEVENEFRQKEKLKDLPENTIGYMDDYTCIEFLINNGFVEKIIVYSIA